MKTLEVFLKLHLTLFPFFTFILSQLTKLTKINVWTYVYFWSGKYPKGPDDPMCNRPALLRRNQTAMTAE